MINFIIRKATLPDCKDLAELANKLNEYHAVYQSLDADKLNRDFDKINAYVAQNDAGDLLGFLQGYETYFLHQAMRGYEIQNLYVVESARKTGLGRSLVQHVVSEKSKDGTEIFRLTVLKSNNEALLFYKSLGFEFKDGNIVYFGKLTDGNIQACLNSKRAFQ
jgi:ribosomal protein S18 acetylase RimI-like enzyme